MGKAEFRKRRLIQIMVELELKLLEFILCLTLVLMIKVPYNSVKHFGDMLSDQNERKLSSGIVFKLL